MDGTLVDTEPYWIAAETQLIAQHGGSWTHEDALEMVGLGLWESAKILQAAGVDLDADSIVYQLTDDVRRALREQGIPWQPGALELLRELREAGVPTALVTMSIRAMAEDVVELAGFDAFDVLVTGDEVSMPKPFPEPYLRALELLGADAAGAVAIEDSVIGIQSAHAAGVVAIGVPHMISLEHSLAHVVWPSLHQKTRTDLELLLAKVRA